MNLLKFVGILAAVAIPILVLQREEQLPQVVESDEIFDEELTAD